MNGSKIDRSTSDSTTEVLDLVGDRLQIMRMGETKQRHNERPQDLIMHETLRNLIHSVGDLERRCGALEAENQSLKSELTAMRGHESAGTDRRNVPCESARNISGYASSENSDGEYGTLISLHAGY